MNAKKKKKFTKQLSISKEHNRIIIIVVIIVIIYYSFIEKLSNATPAKYKYKKQGNKTLLKDKYKSLIRVFV